VESGNSTQISAAGQIGAASASLRRSQRSAVALGALCTLVCGFSYAWSVYLWPTKEVFGLGHSQSVLPFAFCMLCFGISMPLAGRRVDKMGPRSVLWFGAALIGLGHMLCALSDTFWLLLLGHGLLYGLGIGCVYSASTVAHISRWFAEPKARARALGLTLMGFGLGPVLAAPLLQWVIDATDFRVAFVVSGTVQLLLLTPALCLTRFPRGGELPIEHSAEHGRNVTLAAAMTTWRIWVLAALFFLTIFGGLMTTSVLAAVVGVISPIGKGLGPAMGAAALMCFGLCNGLGRPLFSWLAPLLSLRAAMTICSLLMACGLGNLYAAQTGAHALAASAMVGLAFGGTLTLHPIAVAERYGAAHVSKIFGVVFMLGFGLGGFAGTIIGGWLATRFFTFDAPLLVGLLLAVLSALGSAVALRRFRTPPADAEPAINQRSGWRIWPHNWAISNLRRVRLAMGLVAGFALLLLAVLHHRLVAVTLPGTIIVSVSVGELEIEHGDGSMYADDVAVAGPLQFGHSYHGNPSNVEWRPYFAGGNVLRVPLWPLLVFPALLWFWCHGALMGLARGRIGRNCGNCGYDLRGVPLSGGSRRCPECGQNWLE